MSTIGLLEISSKKIVPFNNRGNRILGFMMEGCTNQAITLELGVIQQTIENNLFQIYELLGVRTFTEGL